MNRLLVICLLVGFSFAALPQKALAHKNIVTSVFKVDGVCGQCKKRIEDAAYIKGVKTAEWDKKTHQMTVTYDSSKTNVMLIEQSIAHAGHNTQDVPVTDEDYQKLPKCCRYKTGTKEH